MSVDPTVIKALEAAVKADPSQTGVRLHLTTLLLEAQRPGEALEHARALLALNPADPKAIDLAARSAEQLGQDAVATGYRQLLVALGGEPAAPAVPEAPESAISEPTTPEATAPETAGPIRSSPPTPPTPDPPSSAPASEPEGNRSTSETDRAENDGEADGQVVKLRLIRGGGDEAEEEDFAASEVPEITLADVAGLDEVKRRIEISFLAPMRNPELRKMYRKSLRGGLLLYGPPGCGKTFLARALAGEMEARFLSVGLNEVLDMWMGASERNLHELFELARRDAPCVLFIDEIDALGRKRSLMRHAASMTTVVNQFLTEMDGVDGRNEGVYVLAATNQPWDVDPALRRPGRLDRTLLVLPPDREARRGILAYHLRERPHEGLDLGWMAARTDGYSGADLAHLCDAATELAIEDSVTTGELRPVRQRDFKRVLREVRASTRLWFETARNYALFDNEGGAYDDLVAYLKKQKLV